MLSSRTHPRLAALRPPSPMSRAGLQRHRDACVQEWLKWERSTGRSPHVDILEIELA